MSCIMILGEFSWVNLKKMTFETCSRSLFHAGIPTLFLVVCLFVLEKSLINQFQQVNSEIVPGKCHQVSFCKLPPGNLTWSLNMTHLGRGFTQKNHGDGLHGYLTNYQRVQVVVCHSYGGYIQFLPSSLLQTSRP